MPVKWAILIWPTMSFTFSMVAFQDKRYLFSHNLLMIQTNHFFHNYFSFQRKASADEKAGKSGGGGLFAGQDEDYLFAESSSKTAAPQKKGKYNWEASTILEKKLLEH